MREGQALLQAPAILVGVGTAEENFVHLDLVVEPDVEVVSSGRELSDFFHSGSV